MNSRRVSFAHVVTAILALASVTAGTVAVGASSPVAAVDIAAVTCDTVGATDDDADPSLDSYEAMVPERVIDTRLGTGGVDEALGAGCTLVVDTTSFRPSGAVGVALSLTVVSQETGFFTAFPCAQGQPGTSSVNARPGLATANLVIVAPDSAGEVCIFSSSGGHVIVDVSGWWSPGGDRFAPVDPVRADDTRTAAGGVKRPAGDVRAIDVAGDDELGVPDDATAVAVNVAAVNPTTNGFLVVYPCGSVPPLASNVNFAAGEQRAVAAIVEVGVDGKICVTGDAETHFVVDVTGYYAPASSFGPRISLDPVDDTRVVDTRRTDVAGVRFGAGSTQRFGLTRAIERPDDTVAAVLNVVAVLADEAGFVTVYPCGRSRPTTSSLNYGAGQTANLVVTALSPDTEICVYTSTGVDLVVDLVGSFAGTPDSLANQVSLSSGGTFTEIDQEFDVDGADYTIHCPTSGIDGTLRLGLAPGVSATIDGRTVTDLDTAVDIPRDELLSIDLRRGSERAEYHVRCVPLDFPVLDVTRSGNRDGWYMTEIGWSAPGNGQFLAILDERGVPVWYKRTRTDLESDKLIDFKLLSTGELVASPISGRGFGISPTQGHYVFGLDGGVPDVRVPDDPARHPVDHHDYVEIRGGNGRGRAIISYPLVKNPSDKSTMPKVDPFFPSRPDVRTGPCTATSLDASNRWMVDGVIQEIGAEGGVWNWSMLQHFGLNEVTYPECFANYPDAPGGSEVDAFHINSLQRVEEAGCEPHCDYIVSARHIDSVFRVDRGTGNVEWILGHLPANTPNKSGAPRLRVLNDPLGGPLRMHDARFIGGLLTMHDNRTGSGQPSRIVAYRIDPQANTATLVSEIDHPEGSTSTQLGSLRGTPDGTLMVGWGATQPMFVEYSTDGRELWRLEMPSNDSAYRIVKYSADTFDPDTLRATAGGSTSAPR